ncbi:MAG: YkgJ family cysteine cluster protein [Promethearchaeota archaeon]
MNSEDDLIRFECTKCGACCREDSLLVTVTGRDISRIAKGLTLGPSEVIRALDFYLSSGIEIPHGLRDYPVVNTEKGPAFIALKKLENGDCVFLKDNLCMIHTIRPAACRSFPFVFSNNDDSTFWGLSALKQICPGLGVGPRVKDSELKELAISILEHLDIYNEFAKEWNQEEEEPTAARLIDKILSDPRFTV